MAAGRRSAALLNLSPNVGGRGSAGEEGGSRERIAGRVA